MLTGTDMQAAERAAEWAADAAAEAASTAVYDAICQTLEEQGSRTIGTTPNGGCCVCHNPIHGTSLYLQYTNMNYTSHHEYCSMECLSKDVS